MQRPDMTFRTTRSDVLHSHHVPGNYTSLQARSWIRCVYPLISSSIELSGYSTIDLFAPILPTHLPIYPPNHHPRRFTRAAIHSADPSTHHLSIQPPIHLFTHPSTYRPPPIYPSTQPSIHPPTHQSTHPYNHPCIHPSTQPFIHPPIYPSTDPTHPSIHPSTHLSIHRPHHLSIHPPNHLSIHPPIYPPTHPILSLVHPPNLPTHAPIHPTTCLSTPHPCIHTPPPPPPPCTHTSILFLY